MGYNEDEALIAINDLSIIKGNLPPWVLRLAMEWARVHQSELLENRNMVQENGKYIKIDPLASGKEE